MGGEFERGCDMIRASGNAEPRWQTDEPGD